MLTRRYTVHFIEYRQVIRVEADSTRWKTSTEKYPTSQTITAADACAAVAAVIAQKALSGDITGTECKVQVESTGEWVVCKLDKSGWSLKES